MEQPSWLTTGQSASFSEPFQLFANWLKEAEKPKSMIPNAIALATIDETGLPNVRMVLLKGFDERGFVFYTNTQSQKGRELTKTPSRDCDSLEKLAAPNSLAGSCGASHQEEADEYYASRPRGSRIGSWASKQSQPLESRFALEKEVASYTAKFAIGEIPRPQNWTGFRVIPQEMEFWQDRPFRLHDRVVYARQGNNWQKTRLYP